MLRSVILTIAMASTFNCQPAEPGPPGPQGAPGPMGAMGTPGMLNPSGTRIVARYVTTEDGAKQFLGWYDSQRNEECSFQMFNGTMRCLPATRNQSGVYFVDPDCTIRGIRASKTTCPGESLPGYVRYPVDRQNCAAERFGRLANMGDIATYFVIGAGCQKDADGDALRFVEIDERDFARGTLTQ